MAYNIGMIDTKTKKVTVTMPTEVIEKLKRIAESEGRSFSSLVSHLATEGAKNKTA